nr:60S acidic ribosomal protein family [Ipomoea trifida]
MKGGVTLRRVKSLHHLERVPFAYNEDSNLFAKLCEKRNIRDLILKVGTSGGGAVVVVVEGAAPTATDRLLRKRRKNQGR